MKKKIRLQFKILQIHKNIYITYIRLRIYNNLEYDAVKGFFLFLFLFTLIWIALGTESFGGGSNKDAFSSYSLIISSTFLHTDECSVVRLWKCCMLIWKLVSDGFKHSRLTNTQLNVKGLKHLSFKRANLTLFYVHIHMFMAVKCE